MKQMEQTLIKLLKMNFNLDDFYSITINPEYYPEVMTLQGDNTPEKLLKYTQLGFSFETNHFSSQCLTAIKEKIKINLT
jgi:hypothetical protein